MKVLTEEFNACLTQPNGETLSLADALDPSVIAAKFEKLGSTAPSAISSGKKREAIDAYVEIVRSKEEIVLLEKEVENMIRYYENRDSAINQTLCKCNPSQNQCDRGKKALLYGILQHNKSLLNKAREVYTHMLKVREEQDPLSSSLTGEESSDTDNEDDEEYD